MSKSCHQCGAIGSVRFVPAIPDESSVFKLLSWVREECEACYYEDFAFPLDPSRPNGKPCFLGFHGYKDIGEMGCHRYSQCRRCGKRISKRRFRGGYSPICTEWLNGAPWAYERDMRVPSPAPVTHFGRKRSLQS